jgi:hypothetical protein
MWLLLKDNSAKGRANINSLTGLFISNLSGLQNNVRMAFGQVTQQEEKLK